MQYLNPLRLQHYYNSRFLINKVFNYFHFKNLKFISDLNYNKVKIIINTLYHLLITRYLSFIHLCTFKKQLIIISKN